MCCDSSSQQTEEKQCAFSSSMQRTTVPHRNRQDPDTISVTALLYVKGRDADPDVHRSKERHHRTRRRLLYGYGGFNISMTPGFQPDIAWIERGGTYVVANIAAAANMATPGTTPAGSPTSRTCSTTSSPPANI